MKKILLALYILSMAVYAQLNFDNPLNQYWESLNNASKGVLGTCYQKPQVGSADVCSALDSLGSVSADVCDRAPNVPGLTKGTNVKSLSSSALKSYCQSAERNLSSAIGNMDIYKTENGNVNSTYANGKTSQQVYDTVNPKKIIGAAESVANKAFFKGDQTTLRALVKQSKKANNLNDISKIKPTDFTAPKDFNDFREQREALAGLNNGDVIVANPVSVSNAINAKIEGKSGTSAKTEADKKAMELRDAIDGGTSNRIGLILEATAREDDIAIPTQDMIELLRDDLKPTMVAKIQQQMAREALVVSEVQQIDEARKNIISLTAQKTKVLNEKFDRSSAENYIDRLLQ
jgi:hypothetical protein